LSRRMRAMGAQTTQLILASTSRYRRELLARFGVRFEVRSPGVDEKAVVGEAPAAIARRLARAKARAVLAQVPQGIVIGSDQVAHLDGRTLGKPGSARAAADQLAEASGREVEFVTAVCVIDGRTGALREHADITRVVFRSLTGDEIARYVEREPASDCAGGFRAEALGIALFERIQSEDPTALIGLPLIALARLLRECDIPIP